MFSLFPSKGFGGFSLTSLILESLSFITTSVIGAGVGGKGGGVGDRYRWNGLNGCGRGSKGFQPFTVNEADKSSFVLGSGSSGSSKGLLLWSVRITRGCPTRSGSGSTNGSSTCLGSGELSRCCVLAPLGPSSVSGSRGCPTRSGSGELLLVCVLALLGPSSASLYSCSDSVVSGSDSESRNVPRRGTVVSGARNVPCLDCAVVRLFSTIH